MKTLYKSSLLILLSFIICIDPLFAQDNHVSNTVIGNGIGIGSALAIAICWTRKESVLTSILAGFFGWFYVVYYLIIRERKD